VASAGRMNHHFMGKQVVQFGQKSGREAIKVTPESAESWTSGRAVRKQCWQATNDLHQDTSASVLVLHVLQDVSGRLHGRQTMPPTVFVTTGSKQHLLHRRLERPKQLNDHLVSCAAPPTTTHKLRNNGKEEEAETCRSEQPQTRRVPRGDHRCFARMCETRNQAKKSASQAKTGACYCARRVDSAVRPGWVLWGCEEQVGEETPHVSQQKGCWELGRRYHHHHHHHHHHHR